ncbi:MAG TPA: VIT domain-containing protein [Allosphingosinicella sp.]|nr:VIT domain-containing protein [Allosphingosinicella sp.]
MPCSKRALIRLCLLLLALPPFAGTAFAQGSSPSPSPSPSLTARVAGIDSEAAVRKLGIETLDVRVRIRGTIAETVITARFANPGREILEGDFTLAMPAGSVVTGYALDIGDRMIEGVLVDQRQARIAYERLVRGRIDPGLAEVGRDNVFRTRVFPIPPGGGRTIRLTFVTPLDPGRGYVLPFHDTGEIGRLTMELEVVGPAGQGLSIAGAPYIFRDEGGVQRFTLDRREARLDGGIGISASEGPALQISRHSNGERFFTISDRVLGYGSPTAPTRSVAILWDRSLSRADDDLDAEIRLARRYLEQARPRAIELVLFDSGGIERVRIPDADALVRRLRAVRYRGATSFAGLAGTRLAGTCLLFSDGLATIDRRETVRPGCALFAVSTARDADRAWLGALARSAGGEAFDLSIRQPEEVLLRLTRRLPRVLDVRTTGGAAIDYSLLDGGVNSWRIVGPMPARGDIVVSLSGLSGGETRRVYTRPGTESSGDGPGALWAAERVALLAASDERSRDSVVDFSRRYSVASPDVSFIVLENGRDYAQARIEPPAGAPAEWRETYSQVRAQMAEQEASQRAGRLETVLGEWREMRQWYATRFSAPRRTRPRDREDDGPVSIPPPMPVPISPPMQERMLAPSAEADERSVMVTGTRMRGGNSASAAPVAMVGQAGEAGRSRGGTIALEPWKPDRPYLQALDATTPATRERVFAEQQREHGDLPAFWLDVADWAWRSGRRADAIAYLLSALELPTRNNQTLAIVADRLLRYGETERAIWLLERLLAAEDDRPQPRRNLALALARRAQGAPAAQARADLARAISLLTEVVMTPWDGAYQGIEMISLIEANRLVPRFRALGGRDIGLDARLIALLDFDLRVTIEWQTEASDVDLWVDEPGGERAIFSNPRTAIGGRLSNDMTQGYGPEEYLLRRAPAGAYEIRANVFAADRLSPNGAQRVTARIIRDYGRPTEREELVDIELLPDETERERRVGTVTFGPRAAGPVRPRARNRARRAPRR